MTHFAPGPTGRGCENKDRVSTSESSHFTRWVLRSWFFPSPRGRTAHFRRFSVGAVARIGSIRIRLRQFVGGIEKIAQPRCPSIECFLGGESLVPRELGGSDDGPRT